MWEAMVLTRTPTVTRSRRWCSRTSASLTRRGLAGPLTKFGGSSSLQDVCRDVLQVLYVYREVRHSSYVCRDVPKFFTCTEKSVTVPYVNRKIRQNSYVQRTTLEYSWDLSRSHTCVYCCKLSPKSLRVQRYPIQFSLYKRYPRLTHENLSFSSVNHIVGGPLQLLCVQRSPLQVPTCTEKSATSSYVCR